MKRDEEDDDYKHIYSPEDGERLINLFLLMIQVFPLPFARCPTSNAFAAGFAWVWTD